MAKQLKSPPTTTPSDPVKIDSSYYSATNTHSNGIKSVINEGLEVEGVATPLTANGFRTPLKPPLKLLNEVLESYSPEDGYENNVLDTLQQQQQKILPQQEVTSPLTNESSPTSANTSLPSASLKTPIYQILNKLGSGNFSTVRLGIHLPSSKKVAIKCIEKPSKTAAGADEDVMRILKEIASLKYLSETTNVQRNSIAARTSTDSKSSIVNTHAIDGDKVIQLMDIFHSNKHIYLVMEYIPNSMELFTLLDRYQYFSEDTSKWYFKQILEAVRFCHTHGVVHRDIKLENILVYPVTTSLPNSPNGSSNSISAESGSLFRERKDAFGVPLGRIKLIDFGFSTFYTTNSNNTTTATTEATLQLQPPIQTTSDLLDTFCGSPSYAAPEMHLSKPYNPLLTDAYACGIILYALRHGHLPFDAVMNNRAKLVFAMLSNKFTIRDRVGGNGNSSGNTSGQDGQDLEHEITDACKEVIKSLMKGEWKYRATVCKALESPWFNN